MKESEKHESNVRGYSRSFPIKFIKSKGSTIFDDSNKKYIDFFAGAGALNYGHNNTYLKKPLIDYIEKDGVTHGLDLATEAKELFIKKFTDHILKPRGLDYKLQFTGPTGTNAVEAAIKLAQIVTGRNNIITFSNAYHGHTKGALRLTANQHYRKGLENDLNQSTYFLPYFGYIDGDFSSASYLEKILDDKGSGFDKPAAIILETIQGEGGVNIAPDIWLKRIRNITKKHNILLIVDDIQVGCGRTGSFFSFEKANITPDLVTLSKSLSGYGLPMSLLLINPDIDQWEPGQHTGTFRGNNLAFVTAAAAIEKYWSDDNFSKEILEKHEILMKNLRRLKSENEDVITDVRGKGLIAGLEFNSGELAGEVSKLAFSNGLMIETCGSENNVLKFLPPLTISKEELIEGVTVIENVLQEVLESIEI